MAGPRRWRRARRQRQGSPRVTPARTQPRRRTGNRGLPAPTRARSLGALFQAPTPHLLAVQVARKRLPPRTTSACPHTASPAKLAMSPAVAPPPTCAARSLFLAAPGSDVTGSRGAVTYIRPTSRPRRPWACAERGLTSCKRAQVSARLGVGS